MPKNKKNAHKVAGESTSNEQVKDNTTTTAQVAEAAVAAMPGGAAARKHRARPEVKYTLLAIPPKDSVCPQEHQLIQAMQVQKKGADVPLELTEPEVFAAVQQAAKDGLLVTKQDPIRILKYYTPRLRQKQVFQVTVGKAA